MPGATGNRLYVPSSGGRAAGLITSSNMCRVRVPLTVSRLRAFHRVSAHYLPHRRVSLAGDAQTFVMLSDFTRPGNVAVDFVVAENGKSASLRICRASTATLAIEDCATSQEVELTLLSRRFNCRHLLTATITGTTGTCAQGVVYIGLPDGRPSEQCVAVPAPCVFHKITFFLHREKMAVLKLATKIAATLPVQPPRLLIQLRQRGLLGAARCPMCGNCHATDATWFRNNSWTSAATREAYLTMPMTNTAVLASGGSGYVPQASGPSGSSLNQAMHMQPVPSPFQMTAELSGVQEALQPAGPGPMYTSRSMGAKVRGNFRRNSGFARNGSITSVSSLGTCSGIHVEPETVHCCAYCSFSVPFLHSSFLTLVLLPDQVSAILRMT